MRDVSPSQGLLQSAINRRLKKPLRGRNVSHQFLVFVWYSTSFFLFWTYRYLPQIWMMDYRGQIQMRKWWNKLLKTLNVQWPIGYGVGLLIKRSSVRIRPWPLRWVLGQGSLLPLSQGEAFTLASISSLAILVKYILAKKNLHILDLNRKRLWSHMHVLGAAQWLCKVTPPIRSIRGNRNQIVGDQPLYTQNSNT